MSIVFRLLFFSKEEMWFGIKRKLLRSNVKVEEEAVWNELVYRRLQINSRAWKMITTYNNEEGEIVRRGRTRKLTKKAEI